MKKRLIPATLAAVGVIVLAAVGAPASTSPPPSKLAPIHGHYAPKIDATNFVRTVDNPYLPYKPGMRIHFTGVSGKTPQTDEEVVLHQTKKVLGVTATVVRDTVSEHGRAIERTFDWYAQDKQGNVWYVGELSLDRHHGKFVKASDSWEAGVNGAKAGIIMPAHPKTGDAYRQEYYPGHALDEARVLRLNGTASVPAGRFTRVLVTHEFSPIDGETEQKFYAAGVGEVSEHVVKGPHERWNLVRITH